MADFKRTFLQGKMNKDVDERLLPDGQVAHAENFRMSRQSGSDMGVGKSVIGNTKLTDFDLTNAKTIGVFPDASNLKLYYFVTSDEKDMVVEFNYRQQLPNVLLECSKPNSLLNFDTAHLITGVNKFVTEDINRDLLAWTDDLNPPRIINIERSKTYGVDGFTEQDISVIKRPPLYPPQQELTYTSTTLENNLSEKYLSFAYRYKYLDGEYSVLSPFTNVSFAPNTFQLDYQTLENEGMVNAFNAVKLLFNTGSERVTDVQLVFKETNNLTVNLIETFNKEELDWEDDSDEDFIFSNSKKYAVFPDEELLGIFDNVPLLAKSQEIIGNRLAYGNYLEGYDLVDVFGEDVALDYTLSLVSEDISGIEFPISAINTTNANDTLVINLAGQDLKKNTRLNLDLFLKESFYDDGDFKGDAVFILNRDFDDAQDLAQDSNFVLFVETILTNAFIAGFEVTEPDDSEQIANSTYSIVGSTATTISIQAPTITYRIDDTPQNPDDNADPSTYTDEISHWTFNSNLSRVLFSLSAVNSSLKTERSYEIGLLYKDGEGRASTSLTGINNTLFIPQKYSVFKNKVRVNVNHKPPVWAKHYNFVIKQSKLGYETIYCTVFYEEGLFRWVKLEGANKDKVKEGDTLILKADLSGVVTEPLEVRVLEVATKVSNFIEANVDESDSDIIEEAGLYMKIKATGFDMNYTDGTFEEYSEYQTAGKNRDNSTIISNWKSVLYDSVADASQFTRNPSRYESEINSADPRGAVNFDVVADTNKPIVKVGAFGYLNDTTNLYEDFEIIAGSKITISFRNYESDGFNERYEKDIIASETHANFQVFWEKEIVNLGDKGTAFDYAFGREHGTNGLYLIVQGEESGTSTERSKLQVDITLLLVEGLVIFETKPTDIDSDIFYEVSETFDITSNNHQGNIQNQFIETSLPAITELDVFNCYVQGNGAESYKIKDTITGNFLNFDLRPTATSIEKYKAVRRYADITYGDPFVESSGVNGLNRFNLAKANFKDDIDKKYGSIQKLYTRDTDLVVFQEDKVHKVLFGKDVLFSPDGTSNLTGIDQVLGQHIAYAGEFGMSLNPESFDTHGNYCYFTDAKRGYVLRLGMDGISEISNYGMRTYFKDLFRDSIEKKKVGGYDPYYDVFVLGSEDVSIFNPATSIKCGGIWFESDLSGTKTFDVDFGFATGDCVLNYNIDNSNATVSVEWNGTEQGTFTGQGNGSLTFDKMSPVPRKAKVTIESSNVKSNVRITSVCPIGIETTVIPVIVGDTTDKDKSILNRFKWSTSNFVSNYKNYNTVFGENELSTFEVLNGTEGVSFYPQNGSTVFIESYKGFADTANFEQDDRLGYYISDTLLLRSEYETAIENATWLTPAEVNYATGDVLNTAMFTYQKSNNEPYLYLIWDYVSKNTPPIAVADNLSVNKGQSITFDLRGNDLDLEGDDLQVEITSEPSYGSVVVDTNGTITYTHNNSNNFDDSFEYRLFDGTAYSNDALVSVVVGVPCSAGLTANGQFGIYEAIISLGSGLGESGISYNAFGVPDRFQIEYDGVIVADSKYVGDGLSGTPPTYNELDGTKDLNVFEYDGTAFQNTNTTRTTTVTQADIADGSVNEPNVGSGVLMFDKTTALPTTMKLIVTGFNTGTAWNISGICPNIDPSTNRVTVTNPEQSNR